MGPFVIDASMTLAWAMPDETDTSARAIHERAADFHAHAPSIWLLEVANAFLMAERRKRISRQQRMRMLAELENLGVAVDHEAMFSAWSTLADLAAANKITIYDAAYLELATRLQLPLATRDRELAKAARSAHIEVLS